jgi:hypothetical protein
MIWLANFNAGPISSQFNAAGQAVWVFFYFLAHPANLN